MSDPTPRWEFWVDRGGTFTDIVARRPDGTLQTHKLLSDNPERYADAALAGIRDMLGLGPQQPIPAAAIAAVKMGTTVATNALLERRGERTVLFITRGFRDALRIGYQNRPRLFDLRIVLPELLYSKVVEVSERVGAQGDIIVPLDVQAARADLEAAYREGYRCIAIVFMHAYRYTEHEKALTRLAREAGFTQVSASHQASPLMKLISRGDTTVVDAYLSPILRRHVDQARRSLPRVKLLCMQSNGGLTDAGRFQGKDAILSGPAGGMVGAVRASLAAGFDRIIAFDMGGTSTDVSHYAGEFERSFETQVAGVRLRAPMLSIHTVAAGGGSLLCFDGSRYRVGPDSAGANPGPACYRRGGPLTVTDANVMLGRIRPECFPKVFGSRGDESLDAQVVRTKFAALAKEVAAASGKVTPEHVAHGYIRIAVANMANAIKHISVQRGYDVTGYTLCCFGGAGGQHACQVADELGMSTVFIHPLAGVLSAYGMGLAQVAALREQTVEVRLNEANAGVLEQALERLSLAACDELRAQGIGDDRLRVIRRVHLKYEGTDTALVVGYGEVNSMLEQFEAAYRQRYSFLMPDRPLLAEAVSVEALASADAPAEAAPLPPQARTRPPSEERVQMYCAGRWRASPVYRRETLAPGDRIAGPAIIAEANATTIVEPGWRAEMTPPAHLVLRRVIPRPKRIATGTGVDPVMLELFNNLFMSIAEQMGVRLANTAHSVNIKERLDFSCALFDRDGDLVANAPHLPVHLGSMGESVRTVIRENAGSIRPGNVYMLNAPYHGGTHLPDITVITPVFGEGSPGTAAILFWVASRGHHAEIGGITPGSMPPHSTAIEQEGVLIDNFLLIEQGRLRERETMELLASAPYPSRHPVQNMADLRAMVAANEKGGQELHRMVSHFGLDVVQAYMQHVQDNAEEAVRRVIDVLHDGEFGYEMDNGARVQVRIAIDRSRRSARIDFGGSSPQLPNNFNAPAAVTMAAVLYVFRTLVADDIPLNAGCLQPLEVLIPEGSMLRPRYPAAVVAGNVETSQYVTDALYGALGVMAAAQGTMNNFTFGNERHQYYETICGGSGAGRDFHGADAVHTHMTNTRLTDPEVLEWRYPVRLESFEIRRGSGGRGAFRGGDGARRRIRFLEAMTASILSGHRRVPPYGMAGGEPGEPGRNRVERRGGAVEELAGAASTAMQPGDIFVIETPGGGGWGPPES
jgi:5-oxoprolinase (ATP-hydrolysing)